VNVETLPQLLAVRRPDSSATFLEVPGGPTLTYGELDSRSAQFANALRAAGVRPGDRVALQADKCPEYLVLYLACVRSGSVLLPMNTGYTEDEVAYLVGDASPTLVVRDPSKATTPNGAAVLTLAADGSGSLTELATEQSPEFDDHPVGASDLAAILYTSGTTGRPKGAMLTHLNLASNAAALRETWGFRSDDVLLHALPVFHTHGLFVATNCVLANGTSMVFLAKFDPATVIAQLARCTVMMGVPTFYTRLLASTSFTAQSCRSVRLFISGSAPLLASTHDEFRERTGHAILERYGMTETSMIASNPLHGDRRAGTVGFPLPDVTIRIAEPATGVNVDPDPDAPLGGGDGIGGVEVRGPNVFPGYWNRPELSASEFTADGFFRTGDVGMIDEQGYLNLVGRSKDLIISGGLNVYPKEIEDVIDELPGVEESAVIGIADADFGEAVVAVVVGQFGASLEAATLRAACRDRLAAFKVPKHVVVVEALPRNAMGKVEKAKLRIAYAEGRLSRDG
jgi:malonyl-CoA/methylmalonyl-CoA synthetase